MQPAGPRDASAAPAENDPATERSLDRWIVSQAGIESVRGTSSDSAIGTLLQRQLIALDDHRLFTTTPAFLNYLGLRDLADCLRSRSWKARDCDSTCVDADNEPMSVSRDAAAHIVGVLWPTSCSRGRRRSCGARSQPRGRA
jgi:hypothetical protein